MTKPLVYLAAPYSLGCQSVNVHSQVEVFFDLLADGIVTPFAPLIGSHLANLIKPHDYEFWMSYDFDIIRKCDACFVQDAIHGPLDYFQRKSSGVAREVAFCVARKIPVFGLKADLYDFAKHFQP